MTVFFLGSCRAYDVARLLSRRGVEVATSSHRFLSPRQILQFVQHMRGRPYRYDIDNIHMLSPELFREIRAGKRRDEAIADLDRLRASWSRHTAFVIEVIGIKEFIIEDRGAPFACARFVHSSLGQPYREEIPTEASALATLKEIRALLGGRRIIWLAYAAPDPQGRAHILQNRNHVAGILSRVSNRFGDGFVDPQPIVEQIGQSAFFKDWRNDLDHYTAIALRHVSTQVQALIGRTATRRLIEPPREAGRKA